LIQSFIKQQSVTVCSISINRQALQHVENGLQMTPILQHKQVNKTQCEYLKLRLTHKNLTA